MGKVSPVKLDSSMEREFSSISRQSAGIMSPVLTFMISPTVSIALSISLNFPSLKTDDFTLTEDRSFFTALSALLS